MSINGAMNTSVAGMSVQADRIGVVADNIANASTTGYKRSDTEFETLVVGGGGSEFSSGSVQAHARRMVSQQGTLSYTGSGTDLAVTGNGMFIVSSASGTVALTRAGAFTFDGSGYLVNTAGLRLMGYDITSGDPGIVANGTAGLAPIALSNLSLRAVPSTSGELQVNLPPSAAIIAAANLPSANAATAQYSAKTSLVVYDNIGDQKILDIFFSKSAANTWDVAVFDRSQAPTTGEFPYTGAALATQTLTFDPTNGALATASAKSITIPVPNGNSMVLDLSKTSQVATDFVVQTAKADGSAPVAVDHVEISEMGVLSAVYANGSRAPSYRIPVATVPSPDKLSTISGNAFLPSNDSGDILVGLAGSGSFGTLVSGAVEQSNVDLASELTSMIQAQRSYTANSKVFQAGAEMMDVLVNLRT
jgi:flagellar hook protein FlgE